MGKTLRMDQVTLIIKTYLATKSIKATSRRLKMSINTVRDYIRKGLIYSDNLSEILSYYLSIGGKVIMFGRWARFDDNVSTTLYNQNSPSYLQL